MSTKTIKFKDLPIAVKFKDENNNIFFKVDDNFFYDFKSTILKSKYSLNKHEEFWLITNCANCKYFKKDDYAEKYHFFLCNKLKINYPNIESKAELKENPETFSCSNFEMKE